MKILKDVLINFKEDNSVLSSFLVNNIEILMGVFKGAYSLNTPVIVSFDNYGREVFNNCSIKGIINSLKEEYSFPIFSQSFNCSDFEEIKHSANYNFDIIHFYNKELSLEELVEETLRANQYVEKNSFSSLKASSFDLEKNLIKEGQLIDFNEEKVLSELFYFIDKTQSDILYLDSYDKLEIDKFVSLIGKIKEKYNIYLGISISFQDNIEIIKSIIKRGISVVHISDLHKIYENNIRDYFDNKKENLFSTVKESINQIKEQAVNQIRNFKF